MENNNFLNDDMISSVFERGRRIEEANLSEKDEKYLEDWIDRVNSGEMGQLEDLVLNCDNKFQFAKTHSTYIKDWEKTKSEMEYNLKTNNLPPDVSPELYSLIISETDEIIKNKLDMTKKYFYLKFNESIYNYLGKDGKTSSCFGFFALLVLTGILSIWGVLI